MACSKMINENNQDKFEVRDLREKERFIVDDKFLNGYARFLGIYAVGVYSSLCRHANKEQKCWPSIKKMAQELSIGRNKVIDSIKYLEFWQITKKQRVGKHANNRYLLLSKKQWKPLNETNLKEFSEVYHINFRGLQDKLQEFTRSTSIVRKHNSKETQKKGSIIFSSNKDRIGAYKKGGRWEEKPYYKGSPMRYYRSLDRWEAFEDGQWQEFATKESEIEWKRRDTGGLL